MMETSMKNDHDKKMKIIQEKVKKEMMMMGQAAADHGSVVDDVAALTGGPEKKAATAEDGGGTAAAMRCCQAEKCSADLTEVKQYHKRHRVCEFHAKAHFALVNGLRQRFCQQCSRFHELSEFDDTKRSCRRRLAGHNERRRKTSSLTDAAEGSSRKSTNTNLKELVCGQVDERGRIQISIPEKTTYNKHFR